MRAHRTFRALIRLVAAGLLAALFWGASCRGTPGVVRERMEWDGYTSDGTPCTCEAYCERDEGPCTFEEDCSGDVCWGGHWVCVDGGVMTCEDATCSDADGRYLEPSECLS